MCTQESPLLPLTNVGLVGLFGIEINAIRSPPKRGGGDIGALSGDGSSYKKENKCSKSSLYGALTHWL
jgi:hypothetical protein